MKKYIVEFIGTFFLVLTVALTGNPVAIGFVLVAMVYMGGYISGAHYNPAVTAGLWLSKKIKPDEALRYIGAQMFGGFVAAGAYAFVKGNFFIPSPGVDVSGGAAYLTEILFTFALVSVVHHVAATDKTKDNQYYGLAIGMTLLAAAFAGGPISGGAFNPAVGASPLIFDISGIGNHISSLVLYIVGPLAGGALASIVYKKINSPSY